MKECRPTRKSGDHFAFSSHAPPTNATLAHGHQSCLSNISWLCFSAPWGRFSRVNQDGPNFFLSDISPTLRPLPHYDPNPMMAPITGYIIFGTRYLKMSHGFPQRFQCTTARGLGSSFIPWNRTVQSLTSVHFLCTRFSASLRHHAFYKCFEYFYWSQPVHRNEAINPMDIDQSYHRIYPSRYHFVMSLSLKLNRLTREFKDNRTSNK